MFTVVRKKKKGKFRSPFKIVIISQDRKRLRKGPKQALKIL